MLPGHDSMATAIRRFVQGRRLSLRALQETREALEPFLARLAAERRTEEHLRELASLHEQLIAAGDNFQAFAAINVAWHNAVARASGNELLAGVLYSVSHGVHVATAIEEYDTAETRKQVITIHARVNDAIAAGRGEAAERSMRQHILAAHARPLALDGAGSIPLSKAAPRRRAPAAGRTKAAK
jgi:GntR family transcriptional regulator, transcriptional repressor for pyruvate dehydrogenase complex